MKLLFLGNSNDTAGAGRGAGRAAGVARALEQEFGEPVELEVRPVWPTEALPGLVEKWLHRYEPDMVFISIPGYWFLYESVPLKLQRRWGPPGRWLARIGFAAADNPAIAGRGPFHALRWLAVRTVGGVTHFEPEQLMDVVEPIMRTVVRTESTALVVRPPNASAGWYTSSFRRRWRDQREARLMSSLTRLCDELHVPRSADDRALAPDETRTHGDRNHREGEAMEFLIKTDAEACIAAWRARGEHPTPPTAMPAERPGLAPA